MKFFTRIFVAMALALALFTPAQAADHETVAAVDDSTQTYYMEITGVVNTVSGAITVTYSPGRQLLATAKINPNALQRSAAAKKFTSMADAMNYMAELGWSLESTYTVSNRNQPTIIWVVSKRVKKINDLFEGLVDF